MMSNQDPKTPHVTPEARSALLEWSKYCRLNNLKNKGGGRAGIVSDGYTFQGEVLLLPDGLIQDPTEQIEQPDLEQQTVFRLHYQDIVNQRLPSDSTNLKVNPIPGGTELRNVRSRTWHIYPSPEGAEYASMLAERVYYEDGTKNVFPWLFYADTQQWEAGIPAGFRTPLYGQVYGNKSKFMVHEGEKACDAAIAHSHPMSQHPWQRFLSEFNHISWQGGCFPGAIGGADWIQVNRPTNSIYIMPDNDMESYEASRKLQYLVGNAKALYIIHWYLYEDVIPRKWDIADEVPLDGDGKPVISNQALSRSFYLYELAGETVIQDKRRVYQIKPKFARKFGFVMQTREFVELARPSIMMSTDTFNLWGMELTKGGTKNLAAMVRSTGHCKTYNRPGYRPGGTLVNQQWTLPPLAWADAEKGERVHNIYTPPSILELEIPPRPSLTTPELVPGSRPWRDTTYTIRPFLVYLKFLIPDPVERKHLIRWACNNLTAHKPEDRLPWATLLYSATQGTGKTTLGKILSMLVGGSNSISIRGSDLSDSFTGWMEGKQLITIEEMNDNESGYKLYDSLKDPISNSPITVRRMYAGQYSTESYLTLLGMSNHMSAISIPNSDDDRRWFFPEVTNELLPSDKLMYLAERYLGTRPQDGGVFLGLWNWLLKKEGLQYLLWALRRYGWTLHHREWMWRQGGKSLYRSAFKRAPSTDLKKRISTRSTPEWQELLDDALDVDGDHKVLVVDDVFKFLSEKLKRGVPRSSVITEWLTRYRGYVPSYKSADGHRFEMFSSGRGLTSKVRGRALYHGKQRGHEWWPDDRGSIHWLSDEWKLKMSEWVDPKGTTKKEEELPF